MDARGWVRGVLKSILIYRRPQRWHEAFPALNSRLDLDLVSRGNLGWCDFGVSAAVVNKQEKDGTTIAA